MVRLLLFTLLFTGFSGAIRAQHLTMDEPGQQDILALLADEDEVYELIDIDTLMFVENAGVRRILFDLNGVQFKLTVSEEEVRNSSNAYLIPEQGRITLGIGRHIQPGVINLLEIRTQGPEGTSANIIIADALIEDQTVAFRLGELIPYPQSLSLSSAYPNPFSSLAHIAFEIPEQRITGVTVTLDIYDVQGRLIRSLAQGTFYPGVFQFSWDGADEANRPVGAGVYYYRLISDTYQETGKLVKAR